jgi:NRPS condensation-like uncharacterized protein
MTSDLACLAGANRRYRVEAFDLWHYYSWHRYESCIRIQIDFDEHLDEALLAKALEQSCITFPLIACAFDISPLIRPRWVLRREAVREILRVVEAQGNREEEIQRAFASTMNIKEGPQLYVTLVRDTQGDSLCLTINHMVCDAAGFKQYLRELARLYSRIAEGLDPSPTPFVRQRGVWPIVRELTGKEQLQAFFTAPWPDFKGIIKSHNKPATLTLESSPFSLVTASLPAEDFKHLRAAAKDLGFTVNTLFMAALALTWHRMWSVDKFPLPCAMDVRAFASPDVRMGITNLVRECLCIIEMSVDDMMEDVMAKYVKEMEVYRQKPAGVSQLFRWELLMRVAYFRLADRILRHLLVPYPLSATNMGILDEDCVRFGDASVRSAHMAAAVVPFPAFTVAMSTFRDELTFSTSIEGNEKAKTIARTILATMIEELLAFGSRYPAAKKNGG